MVFILACLSAMLTVGGGAMALYGADLIRTDSGVALTGAGVTMTSAGLLLLGITCLFAEMRRMRRLMEAEEIIPPVAVATPLPMPVPTPGAGTSISAAEAQAEAKPAPATPAPATPVTSAAPASAASATATAKTPPPVATGVLPPTLLETQERQKPPGSGIPAEAMASLVGSAAMMKGSRAPSSKAEVAMGEGGDATAPIEGPHAKAIQPEAPIAGQTSVDTSHAKPTATPEEPVPAAAPATDGPRTMLATYNSGGNTYFMYSDSSIEADMPGGRYRFTSMDELRGFIETGQGGTLVATAETPPVMSEAEKV